MSAQPTPTPTTGQVIFDHVEVGELQAGTKVHELGGSNRTWTVDKFGRLSYGIAHMTQSTADLDMPVEIVWLAPNPEAIPAPTPALSPTDLIFEESCDDISVNPLVHLRVTYRPTGHQIVVSARGSRLRLRADAVRELAREVRSA